LTAGNGTRTHETRTGPDLFHSFSEFNLTSVESATFADLNGVTNVLARVTGGQSSIDGRISCAANLFLMRLYLMLRFLERQLPLKRNWQCTRE
jgi:large exoprotein involved in heme utilization and adhesion